MKNPAYLERWTRISDFPLDNETAAVPFSDKLASEQQWTTAFTKKAIEEYKKFMLLCCVSDTGAAPSKIVDEVWHLHLTYTQSYWTDFCKNTLNKDIHHFPSDGGEAEDQRHREWYASTLLLYKDIFGKNPPADIWPDPLTTGVKLEIPPRGLRIEIIAAILVILLLPFAYSYYYYDTFSPFSLGGPHFLSFFLVYAAALMAAYFLYRYLDNKIVAQIAAANFPADVTPYQVAAFLYGGHRAFQTSLLDFVKKGLLEIREDQRFVIHNKGYQPAAAEQNPFAQLLTEEDDGVDYSYKQLLNKWMKRQKFSHPMLVALEQYAFGRRNWFRDSVFQLAFLAMAVVRIVQGAMNHRPITLLLLEAGILYFLFAFVIRQNSRRATVCKIVDNLYLQHLKQPDPQTDLVLGEYALVGITAISGFAEGILLAGIFNEYPARSYQTGWNTWVGGSGGGSSCGGGGGGGCGGCGGN